MIKKTGSCLFFLGLLSTLLICGCQTCKGAAVGAAATAQGVVKGVAQDSENVWHSLIGADDWIKKNLW
jgi:hypothetical protein